MSLYEDLIEALPELTSEDFDPRSGSITLRDDSDGLGAYIDKWNIRSRFQKASNSANNGQTL